MPTIGDWRILRSADVASFPGITDPFVLINAALIVCMFADLQLGTYCVFYRTSFYRVSYFIFKQVIPLERIREMRFEPTYIFGGSGKSLWILLVTIVIIRRQALR